MLFLKILFAFLTVGSVFLAEHFGSNLWFILTGFAGIQWAKMEVFEIAYGATAAAIKDFDADTAQIEDAIEEAVADDATTMLDSHTFLRRLNGDEDFQS